MAASVTGRVDLIAYGCAQVTITAFHLMTHYANDYFDRASDAGAGRTPYSGGSGALVDGSLAPSVGLLAATFCAAVGLAGAGTLVAVARAPHAAGLAVAIALGAWCYSAPPLRLAARGLGELDTAIVVAILVPLCAYAAQRPAPSMGAFASTLPGASAMFAMMLAVEFPDFAADTVGRKRNLVVRLGRVRAGGLGIATVVVVYAGVAFALAVGAPPKFALLELLTIPLAFRYGGTLAAWRAPDPRDDEALAARGVTFYFVVALCGLLAYAAPLRGL